MDKKKLETFKKRLETRQQELRRTVNRTQADGRSADEDTAQDIADRAASSYTKEFLFSQSNNDRQTLQMVDKALARIREGSFGECIHCGKEINAKRLEAVPWTRHCIECQEKLEQGLLEEAPRYLAEKSDCARKNLAAFQSKRGADRIAGYWLKLEISLRPCFFATLRPTALTAVARRELRIARMTCRRQAAFN